MKLRNILTASVALCVLVIAGVALAVWYATFEDRSHPQAPVDVIVPRGATFAETAAQLAQRGVIAHVATFRILGRLRGEEAAVRAGEYRFDGHQTQAEVLRSLVTGGAQVAAWVTIPEGFTAEQIAGRLQAEGIGPSTAFRHHFLEGSINVEGTRTKNLEGFLFPSTYLVPLGATPGQVTA
ncbi:MAG: endolytic transglycosylase MltG, partial [Candidatus Eremiobacteraeota bacterium]|nr:endolytic transglycosylase MltG [Candidatus Eremiobacteraeota bacterium]